MTELEVIEFEKKNKENYTKPKEWTSVDEIINKEQLNLHDVMCSKFLVFDFKKDIKFWALMPCVNINLHSKEFELEWLCFGLYVRKPFK